MPKMKTHKGAAKRFKLTASGKLKRAKGTKHHFLAKKSSAAKRNLRKGGYAPDNSETRTIKNVLLPYK